MDRCRKITFMLVLALAALPAAVALAKKAPVDLSGTAWHLTVKVQQKLQKVGGMKDVSEARLYFGPNAGKGLGESEFLIKGDDGPGLYGTWSDPDGKGKPVLNFNVGGLLDVLDDNVTEGLEQVYTDVSNVDVQTTSVKSKCKCKPGKGASFSLKVKFIGSAHVDGEDVEGKGTFSAKGKGPELLPS